MWEKKENFEEDRTIRRVKIRDLSATFGAGNHSMLMVVVVVMILKKI